ncbi:MAG: NUDIX domain-containing protein [Roseburia sp.]|nr:NUDIX domain-containing protein [Roseburia sp.]
MKLLIQKRPYNPGKGMWSLIGGFVEQNESIDSSAQHVLTKFTGLHNIYMRQLETFGEVERDPGQRVISIVYYALINMDSYIDHIPKEYDAKWVDIDNVPPLCFDHNKMVDKARKKISECLLDEPICSNLLPRFFTLSQLQTLHESIMGVQIDKRNFRRSIAEKKYVIKTEMIDKGNSRRGASLYEFSSK